ncbi:unnamed protein product [Adineta ricciae]|uniref:Uncharacterized protein n=1 Tax=Adineta ricciae TaxID=249248 RepID=A0A813YSG8_ADIRI|nr:unnamed protein product [Adineta ricciae]
MLRVYNTMSGMFISYMGILTIILGVIGGVLNIIISLSLCIFHEHSSSIYLVKVMSVVNLIERILGYLYRILVDGFLAE